MKAMFFSLLLAALALPVGAADELTLEESPAKKPVAPKPVAKPPAAPAGPAQRLDKFLAVVHPRLLVTPERIATIRRQIQVPGSHHQLAYAALLKRTEGDPETVWSKAGYWPVYASRELAFLSLVAPDAAAPREAQVQIVTGDTKVVNKGSADRLFVNTAGVGRVAEGIDVSGSNAKPGDKVILSGTIGDHGIAVLSQREGLGFSTRLESDCAPLNGLVAGMMEASKRIHAMRDPTRGGLATTLNEIAAQSKVSIRIEEEKGPVRDEVRGACEMLGIDPLYVANEGKLVAIVHPEHGEAARDKMRHHR